MLQFLISDDVVSYTDAIQAMQKTVNHIRNGGDELIWFLQHPPLITAGTNAKDADLLNSSLPIFQSQRGGKHTYHGPGQLVVYIMVDLKKRNNDIRLFVKNLEQWVIDTLATLNLASVRKEGRIGVWIDDPKGERKIAAIGLRVSHGITWHGISLNINPDLDHYADIIPCGLKDFSVTSLAKEGYFVKFSEVIEAMKASLNFL